MDEQRKTIQSLTTSLNEKLDGLQLFYRQFGIRLFGDSVGKDQAAPVDPQRVETWRALMVTRETDTQAVLDIRAAVNRQQELARFKQELDRTIGTEKTRYRDQLASLGRSYFGEFQGGSEAGMDDIQRKIAAETTVLSNLEQKRENLSRDAENSGFFSKMIAQFKLSGVSSLIRQSKERMNVLLADGVKGLVSGGGLKLRVEAGEFNSAFVVLFEATESTSRRLDDLSGRVGMVTAESESLVDTLRLNSASESPGRRMNELQAKIRDIDNRTDSLAIQTAREYTDKFLDEAGLSVLGGTGDGNTFSDMGAYAYQLEEVAGLRSEIDEIRCRIEILETALRIENLDRNVRNWQRTIGDYEAKIRHYEQLIIQLHTSISTADAERVDLSEHKKSLEQKLL